MSRAATLVPSLFSLLSLGCLGELLPGEIVLPGDLPTETWEGWPGSAFGAAVAEGPELLIGAPGVGSVLLESSSARAEGERGLGNWVWWEGELPRAAQERVGVFGLESGEPLLLLETRSARSFHAGEFRGVSTVLTVGPQGIALYQEALQQAFLEIEGVHRAIIGADRILGVRCGGDRGCEVFAWRPPSEKIEVLSEVSSAGALLERQGVAWWGDPQDHDEEGRGRACSEQGECLEGLVGDHLGRSLCDGFAAGVFNKWQVPARARVLSLDGSVVFAIDRAVEDRALSLDRVDSSLVIGVPGYAPREADTGRVIRVDLGLLPGFEP